MVPQEVIVKKNNAFNRTNSILRRFEIIIHLIFNLKDQKIIELPSICFNLFLLYKS